MSRVGVPRVALLAGVSPYLSAAVLARESAFDEVIRVEPLTPLVTSCSVDDAAETIVGAIRR